jgi:hypothetical protein
VTAAGSIILKVEDDGTVLAKSHPTANDAFLIRIQKPEGSDAPSAITAVRLRTLPHPSLPANGPGTAANGNFVLTDFALKAGSTEKRFARAWADHSQPSYPIEHAIDEKNTTGWAINVDAKQAASGVRMNAAHEAIFVLEEPVAFVDDILTIVMRHDLNKNYLVGHFAIELSTELIKPQASTDPQIARLDAVRNRINELENVLPAKGKPVKQMVMKDLDKPPETFVLTRGDFLSPDRERGPLMPGFPVSLNHSASLQTPANSAANRLDLARWLVSRDNPLTARVTVNRVWAKYFGRGLVETENDFGFQGTEPTHPELLDWLAAELMETGWSMKHLHRTILLSATYRQSSARDSSTDAMSTSAVDPENNLLGRQTRFRVEAEVVRDLALVASGLFAPKIGGPGIHLPQPEGIYDFTQNKKEWPTASGPDRYRRTMYTMFYRSAPYPLLSTFDAPDFSTVCTRRVRSNTPLQSLTLANDVVFTELAEGLARGVTRDRTLTSDEQRCRVMFRRCLTREPVPAELDVLLNFYSRELSRFTSAPDEAAKFVKREESDVEVAVLAAWTSVARSLLNTDEFLMRN